MSNQFTNQTAVLRAAIDERQLDLEAYRQRLIAVDVDPTGYSFNLTERNRIVVGDISDLPSPVGGVITLPTGSLVQPVGLVDLGSNRIELSAGSSICGLDPGRDGFMSTTSSAVISGTDIGQVIMRNFFVVNVVGSAFDITTSTDSHVNFFFVGVLGSRFGSITGGRVCALEFCYSGQLSVPGIGTFRPTGGVVFDGSIGKVYVVNTPFEDLNAGVSAITLSSSLVADVVDIKGNFFKGDDGVGVTAESGYTIAEGLYTGNLITDDLLGGNIVPTVGFDGSDVNWTFADNTGTRNSKTLGLMSIDVSSTTDIVTVNVPVKVAGTTTAHPLNERFSHSTNRLTYTGNRPVEVSVVAASYITSAGNNKEYRFWVAKNGVPIPGARATVRIASGGDRRAVTVIALAQLVTSDYLELWVEGITDSTDVTVLDSNFLVTG